MSDISIESVERLADKFQKGAADNCFRTNREYRQAAATLRAQAERIKELEGRLAEAEDRANAFATKEMHTAKRAKTARNDTLRDVLQGCNMVLDTDQCGSGTEYDKGFKAAAQQCVDVVENHMD